MQDKVKLASLYNLRADKVRAVAGGLFNWEERKKALQIADECERRARDVEGIDNGDCDEAKTFRVRAEALRTIAEATVSFSSREILVHIAEVFERKAPAREAMELRDLKPRARNST